MNGTTLNVARNATLGALIGLVGSELGIRGIIAFKLFAVWVLLWAVVAAFVAWRGHERIVTLLAAAAVVLLLLVSSTPLVSALTSRWIRSDPVRGPVDAVVVLSSDVKGDTLLDLGGTERLLSAVEVLRATHAPRLVTTRVRSTRHGDLLTTDAGQRRLLAIARIDSGWTIAGDVTSTRDEALRAARLLLPSASRIALVTSSIHTRRACATFERVGFTVTCVAAHDIARVTRDPESADDRLYAFRSYLYERVGTLKYRWSGWIRG